MDKKQTRLSTQYNKLSEKIKIGSVKERDYLLPEEQLIIIKKQYNKDDFIKILNNYKNDLKFFKHLLEMIKNGATGFDLAYEVEKNHAIKKLIYDGMLFYNNFVSIGNEKFIEIPNVKEVRYKSFKTVEKTEKYIFLLWIEEMIKKLEEILFSYKDITDYNKNQLYQSFNMERCEKCGHLLKDDDQILCENCGAKIRDIDLTSK
ncbi:MAG: zinc ribbon domain-containing protein [Candidatus Lokiarchaeota archaeon]|nr:zinc ribbon domain-containing protein [Candidatus Lokiarchaeota archaeon]